MIFLPVISSLSSTADMRKRSWKKQQDEPATAVTKPLQILLEYCFKDSRSVFVLTYNANFHFIQPG